MAKIRCYTRTRPPLDGEFDVPGCFKCIEQEDESGNWLQVVKDGESKRYFSRCWGKDGTQEQIFRTIGVPSVNDCFEGYYSCVFCYGQTGTGKTFTLGCSVPGLEGVQPRCLKMIFEKIKKESEKYDVVVKNQYVQMYRDSVQDLMNIQKDDLVVRVDDTIGAIIEDCTTIETKSYEEAMAVIQEGDSNRKVANTKMNSGSSRSHACLITEIHRTNKATGEKTIGKLYLIDLAGSERVSKSGVTGEQFKEAVAINKSLTVLGNVIAGLVSGEKMIAFRDSKLTRVLQHSLSGHGRTSVIICLRPDSPNLQETLCTIKFGERAQKVEAQMTPAGYREQVLEFRDKVLEEERLLADDQTKTHVMRSYADNLMKEVVSKEAELKELEESSQVKVRSLRAEHDDTKKRLKQEWEAEKAKMSEASKERTKELREANKTVLEEIDRKVEVNVADAKRKNEAALKPLQEQLESLQRQAKKLAEQTASVSVNETELRNRVAAELARLSGEKKICLRKLQGCKPSRHSGYDEMSQINGRAMELKTLRDVLARKREWLSDAIEDWDEDGIGEGRKAFKRERKTEDDYRAYVAENRGWETPESSDDDSSDDDSSPPPSSEPPPSSSDDDSSSYDSSSSGSGSDDFASSGSDAGSDDEEAAEAVEIDWGGGPVKKKKKGKIELPPRAHFDHALKRNKQLAELVEQIADYLEYGCPCYVLNVKSTEARGLHKRHLFLSKGRKLLCVCEYKSGGDQPDRSTAREIMPLSEIAGVTLGQFSDGFNKALENAPVVPPGTTMPATSSKVSLNSLPVFFYRSLTINSKDKPIIDIVLDTDTDYEAWLVTLHRLTNKEPKWGGLLELTNMRDVHRLTDDEVNLCQECHILPSCLSQSKEMILSKQKKVFYTLFDMRQVSSLDMLHAQRLFEFFISQGYFERVSLNHVRYLEMQNEIAEENAQKEMVRKLRLRIVNMHRKYNPGSSEQALHSLLKSCAGNEQQVLNMLVEKHGPEPSEDDISKMEGGAAAAQAALDDAAKPREEGEKVAAPNANQIKQERPPPGAGASGGDAPAESSSPSSSSKKDDDDKKPRSASAADSASSKKKDDKHADPAAGLPSEADGGASP